MDLLISTGVAGSFVEAAQGFASDTVFFLLSATLIAQGVANAGLIERIARFSTKLSGARLNRAVWLVAGLTGATALVMPSALVRTKAYIPVAQRISKLLRPKQEQPEFLTATGLVMALLGHVASISVMTGGGILIVATGTIAEFTSRSPGCSGFS